MNPNEKDGYIDVVLSGPISFESSRDREEQRNSLNIQNQFFILRTGEVGLKAELTVSASGDLAGAITKACGEDICVEASANITGAVVASTSVNVPGITLELNAEAVEPAIDSVLDNVSFVLPGVRDRLTALLRRSIDVDDINQSLGEARAGVRGSFSYDSCAENPLSGDICAEAIEVETEGVSVDIPQEVVIPLNRVPAIVRRSLGLDDSLEISFENFPDEIVLIPSESFVVWEGNCEG